MHELKVAVFTHYERNSRTTEALALITANPEMIVPVLPQNFDHGAKTPVSFARVRALAKKTGDFQAAVATLEALRNSGAPDVEVESAMLQADWSIAKNEPSAAIPHLLAAAAQRPTNWEYVRRAAEAHASEGRKAEARGLIERFLTAPQPTPERDAAVALWEKK